MMTIKKWALIFVAITIGFIGTWFLPLEPSFMLRRYVAKVLYENGHKSSSHFIYRRLHGQNDPVGTNNLAVLKYTVHKDTSRQERRAASALLKQASSAGLAIAQYNLATRLIGFTRNERGRTEVAKRLKRASDLGDKWSTDLLALGNDPNLWFWMLAADGDINAAYHYAGEQRLAGNDTEREKGLRLAAEAGIPWAMEKLGRLLAKKMAPTIPSQKANSDSSEVQPPMPEAEKWFRRAAKKGNISAAYFLGECYHKGYRECRTQDYSEARKFYKKAIENRQTARDIIYPPRVKMESDGTLRLGYPKITLTPTYSAAVGAAEELVKLP